MDNFILRNDTWLRYLPMIIFALVVVICVLLIVIAFLILKKYRNRNLRSQRRRSAFALEYVSDGQSAPRPVTGGDERLSNITPPRSQERRKPVQEPAPQPAAQDGGSGLKSDKIIDLYFEYEDEFRI